MAHPTLPILHLIQSPTSTLQITCRFVVFVSLCYLPTCPLFSHRFPFIFRDRLDDLGKLLKRLLENDAEYEEYLKVLCHVYPLIHTRDFVYKRYKNNIIQWKDPHKISPQFKALVDINNIHGQCRLCMKAADNFYNLPAAPYGPEREFARLQLERMSKERSRGDGAAADDDDDDE